MTLEPTKMNFENRSEEIVKDALDANKWVFVFAGYGND